MTKKVKALTWHITFSIFLMLDIELRRLQSALVGPHDTHL
jgi:hypothetical protein